MLLFLPNLLIFITTSPSSSTNGLSHQCSTHLAGNRPHSMFNLLLSCGGINSFDDLIDFGFIFGKLFLLHSVLHTCLTEKTSFIHYQITLIRLKSQKHNKSKVC